jgi:pimeloyl-ACP methyl ester carboxylesterase
MKLITATPATPASAFTSTSTSTSTAATTGTPACASTATRSAAAPTRRHWLGSTAAAAVALSACAQAPIAATPASRPRNFVLVHGAWHGAWCWRELRKLLQAHGHQVFTPTLTGMGALHHLSSAAVNLNTHIQDIVAAIETEELQGVELVAHSYAGYPATAALARVAARVSRIVYLDSLLPTPGQSAADAWPPQALAGVKATLGEGFRLAAFPAAAFGVPEGHPQAAWVQRRLTDMPIGPLLQPFPAAPLLTALPVPALYLRCTQSSSPDIQAAAARAVALKLPMVDLDSGHDAMVTAPAALARLLLQG